MQRALRRVERLELAAEAAGTAITVEEHVERDQLRALYEDLAR